MGAMLRHLLGQQEGPWSGSEGVKQGWGHKFKVRKGSWRPHDQQAQGQPGGRVDGQEGQWSALDMEGIQG